MGECADRVRVGVSSCLVGQSVRHDGAHKHDRYVADVLGEHFELLPVCPEVESGMGVPREPVRLVREGGALAMRGVRSGDDHTTAMQRWAKKRIAALVSMKLCGYILKKGSPSCGMERVRTYTTAGMPAPNGRGLFAAALMEAMPLLPVEEEGRLSDPVLRESFIERVFAYARVHAAFAGRWSLASLVAFHSREKLLVMSHSPSVTTALGRLVAGAKSKPRADVAAEYSRVFLEALAKPATRRRQVNVLQHALGYFRDTVDAPTRRALAASIEDYRTGLVPLVVPLTLLRHYGELRDVEYLRRQTWLEPHPRELMLRNHV